MIDLDQRTRCEGCGQPFKGTSKPHWVFDAAAKPLGLMHAGCAATANPRHPGTEATLATEKEAQFIAWTDLVDKSEPLSARELAIIMSWAVHPSLRHNHLSENQLRWIERYDSARQRAIRAAYNELLSEFATWLAES